MHALVIGEAYRGTSLIRNNPTLGPYSRTIPRVRWWSYGGGLFLMSEVPLYYLRLSLELLDALVIGEAFEHLLCVPGHFHRLHRGEHLLGR